MPSYTENLGHLYDYTGANKDANDNQIKPYVVAPLLYKYIENEADFNTALNMAEYFSKITGRSTTFPKATIVPNSSGDGEIAVPLATNGSESTAFSTASCPVTSTAATGTGAEGEEDTGADPTAPIDISKYDVMFNLTTSAATNDVAAVKSSMTDAIIAFLKADSKVTDRYVDHESMNEYFVEILKAICKVQFESAMAAPTTYGNLPSSQVNIINNIFKNNTMLNNFFDKARAACNSALSQLAETISLEQTYTFISEFGSRTQMSTADTSNYRKMLSLTIQKIKTPTDFRVSGPYSNQITLTAKKIVADTYIKTCYPFIHFDFLDVLKQKYVDTGDFVNARFALLAKTMFVFRVVDATFVAGKTDEALITQDFITNLRTYIQFNNKSRLGAQESAEDTMASVIIELQKLSSEVTSQAESAQELQSNVAANQLTLRNLIESIASVKSAARAKMVEFYILCGLLVVLITACGVLMYLEMTDYATIVAGVYLAGAVIYKTIMIVIELLRKN